MINQLKMLTLFIPNYFLKTRSFEFRCIKLEEMSFFVGTFGITFSELLCPSLKDISLYSLLYVYLQYTRNFVCVL